MVALPVRLMGAIRETGRRRMAGVPARVGLDLLQLLQHYVFDMSISNRIRRTRTAADDPAL
jgi:hypothetical protein